MRVLRACRELGIPTVAVYSEADRQSLHVRYADEAYLLGPAPARDSYLRADKILDIARRCGADAIHPGYGFLAEREDFARGCEDAGIVFIGPKPSSIAAMGDKTIARATVAKAGIPVVPGTEGEGNLTDEELIRIAPQVGFPLLVKASAGGGGKGMREVTHGRGTAAPAAGRPPRGRSRLRRRKRVPRKAHPDGAPRGIPDPGRRRRQRHLPRRTRMLAPAPAPEAVRGGALALHRQRRRTAPDDGRSGLPHGRERRLSQRRNDRIPGRQGPQFLIFWR